MSNPDPLRPPSGHPADSTEWREYLQRYDRYLDICERHLEQTVVYNGQVAEATRAQAQVNEVYERWVRWQRQMAVGGVAIGVAVLVLILAIAGVVSLVRQCG
jgi:hypothetical protein